LTNFPIQDPRNSSNILDMGKTFSATLERRTISTIRTWHTSPASPFLDILAEVRLSIDRQLLPSHGDIDFFCKDNGSFDIVKLCDKPILRTKWWQRVARLAAGPDDKHSVSGAYRDRRTFRQTCVAMLRTCRSIHEELGTLFYQNLRIVVQSTTSSVVDFSGAFGPESMLRGMTLLTSVSFNRWTPAAESREKLDLSTVLEQLPNISEMCLVDQDMTGDAQTKGTRWKPKVLRRMIYVLENSEKLSRVYFKLRDMGSSAEVRFTDAKTKPWENVSHPFLLCSCRC
jgi:hypothetical protein